MIAVGAVGQGDFDLLADDGSADPFKDAVRARFHAGSSSSQGRSIFETVANSLVQLCIEDGLASRIEAMQADRVSFLRHKRGGHPRYAALAARLIAQYERVFFAIYGERALAHVNMLFANWKRAGHWYRERC